MDNAVRQMFSVSKDELAKREAKWKREHGKKKTSSNRPSS